MVCHTERDHSNVHGEKEKLEGEREFGKEDKKRQINHAGRGAHGNTPPGWDSPSPEVGLGNRPFLINSSGDFYELQSLKPQTKGATVLIPGKF